MPASRPLADRLAEKILRTERCWIFTGAIANNGYGRIGSGGRVLQAHRVAYEVFVGEIPSGMHVDHLCRNRRCVNPEHLEAVTQQENNRRAGEVRRANATHCKRGHEFTDENTFWEKRGYRQCRICMRASRQKARAKDLAVLLGGERE